VSADDRTPPRVRRASADDVDAVTALEAEIFGDDAWSRDSVLHELTHPLRHAHVAVDDAGQVCGYVAVLGVGQVADLHRIAVSEAMRRRGVAAALLDACDLSPYERVVLEVRADNGAALAFYRRYGFAEISRRRGYYADGADAVVMRRHVTGEAGR
jgi:[ribosomal protein S18]-alanine N-acetyltransferase